MVDLDNVRITIFLYYVTSCKELNMLHYSINLPCGTVLAVHWVIYMFVKLVDMWNMRSWHFLMGCIITYPT